MAKILIACDTASNHYGGVNLRLPSLVAELKKRNHEVCFINADLFKGFYLPFAKAIKIPLLRYATIKGMIEAFKPDFIHIETEGPIGQHTRKFCLKNKLKYTTAYSSRYDIQLYDRIRLPKFIPNRYVYQFHKHSAKILVRTQSIKNWLNELGLAQASLLECGIDNELFYCHEPLRPITQAKPRCLYAGRIEKEKNLSAFLEVNLDIEKVIIGNGSQLNYLKKRYPKAHFVGFVKQSELGGWYNDADVFVFPSKSETLGNVMLEAMSCGLPVAAFPVCGPIDVVKDGVSGFLDQDLSRAIQKCLSLSRQDVLEYAKRFSQADVADNFLQQLVKTGELQATSL